jgi:uncharacterized membrane protein
MKASANIGGHPIHPALVPIPIGLWVFALVADVMFIWRGNPAWEYVAFYCIAGGILGAAIAALFGLIDLFGVKNSGAFRVGLLHAGLNVTTLLIFILNFYFRTSGGKQVVGLNSGVTLLLSVIGVLILGMSGWLGGELVFRYGLGVEVRPEGDPGTRAP